MRIKEILFFCLIMLATGMNQYAQDSVSGNHELNEFHQCEN